MAERNQRTIAGLVLIAAGLAFFIINRVEGIGFAAIYLVTGAAFLAAYFYSRNYGYLVPGCILLGLGAGSLRAGEMFEFDSSMLGLGCGFIGIFVLALIYERKSHWWPLIPGVVLILLSRPNTKEIVDYVFDNWPLILIAIGVLILLGSLRKPKRRSDAG